MLSRIRLFVVYYFFWVLAFLVQKPLFLLSQWSASSVASPSEWVQVCVHGLPMDLSTAGYFSLPLLLLLLLSCFVRPGKWWPKVLFGITVALIAFMVVACVADMFLYPYWGYKLDVTPLFYMRTPKDAAASGTPMQYLLSVLIFAAEFVGYFFAYRWLHRKFAVLSDRSLLSAIPMALGGALLFLAIRGGVTVSVMNVGRVYFSKTLFLNHAAINPVWNFFSSFSKEDASKKQYHFMDDAKAHQIFSTLTNPVQLPPDVHVLSTQRPNVLVLVLESFGSNVCECAGGVKGLTPNLDREAREGIFFSNFYANSFRTDRGLVAILSAYPGQTVTSLMKYPDKSVNVPKWPLLLKQNGYHLKYYYGGDENFTNMRSYLVTGGFEERVSDKDFSRNELSAKWGAYDHVLMHKVIDDLSQPLAQPFCKVVQTLNSHEPFDVPYHKFSEPYLNSVAYSDSCVGLLMNYLRKSPLWKNTLVILLPDHARKYPDSMTEQDVARYKAPMIWTGGAVKGPLRVTDMGSQIDLARTLLAQLNIDGSCFNFSKNIFSHKSPKFAFFAYNEGLGFVTPQGASVFDCAGNMKVREDDPSYTLKGQAYLQCLYDDLAKR